MRVAWNTRGAWYTNRMDRETLKRRREELGMSQSELAAVLEVRQQTISEWETGTRAIRLGRILELALDALARDRDGRGGDD